MASHKFAIAKASFSAGLLRPDPTSLSREDIARFHSILNAAVAQCSPTNVQNCKRWILENIVQSSARFAALGKYLTALATSYGSEPSPTAISLPTKREPSIKRKRLHILYILNDILYHAKYRANDASICSKVQPMLMSLFANTASFKGYPKQQHKVLELLNIWEENGYYSPEYINKLRETVRNASESGVATVGDGLSGAGEQDPATKITKTAPYVMPAMHGDASTPWFDLPAGNLMPHIIPNSTRPINPDMIKPLQFVAGPADEVLALAVKTLLDDVQKIFGVETEEDDGLVLGDIDELGQPIIIDEITGDVLEGEGYYGWSRTFCEKMKRRRNGYKNPTETYNDGRRSRSRSSSSDRHRGKRRRYSDSDNGSSRSSRSRRGRSFSSSRSPSPENGRRTLGNRDSHSRSRSPSNNGRSPPPSLREPSDSTPTVRPQSSMEGLPPKPPPSSYTNPPMMFPQNMPPHFNPNFPPPPPPPNMAFNGPGAPWIPPPPPLHNNAQFNTWPPPPPIPPPNYAMPPGPSGGWQAPALNQGRGGYNNKNNGWHGANQGGRGGRGDYRGRGWS